MIEGSIFRVATFADVPDSDRAAYLDAMHAAIAALHRLDPAALGLANYGRSGNYFARRIARWARQYLDEEDAGRNADMDALLAWLGDDNSPGGKLPAAGTAGTRYDAGS